MEKKLKKPTWYYIGGIFFLLGLIAVIQIQASFKRTLLILIYAILSVLLFFIAYKKNLKYNEQKGLTNNDLKNNMKIYIGLVIGIVILGIVVNIQSNITFPIIMLILAVFFFYFVIKGIKIQKEVNEKLKNDGYNFLTKIEIGKYLGGHPDIDEPTIGTILFPKDNKLEILVEAKFKLPIKKGEIENRFIKNITVEDQSTVEKRVTVGRLLMTGIFAFAWKKKNINELAYLTIEWNDGKFEHETIFEMNGKGAMQNANTARNKLIKIIR